jgi:hypothetical protein
MRLPLLGSNQDSPDPEKARATVNDRASAPVRSVAGASAHRSGDASAVDPRSAHHSHRSSHHAERRGSTEPRATVPAFIARRSSRWLASLPQCQPKESPAYQRWLAARNEAARAARPRFVTRHCWCGTPFRPKVGNQRRCPACVRSDRRAPRALSALALAATHGDVLPLEAA